MRTKPSSHSTVAVHPIVKFIREERVEQGLTQQQLGNAAGLSKSAVGRFECAYNPIKPLYTLERMLAALGYKLSIVEKGGR